MEEHTRSRRLNAREQKENGSIRADIHDVLSNKLHIQCFIFEIEDTIAPGVCYRRRRVYAAARVVFGFD